MSVVILCLKKVKHGELSEVKNIQTEEERQRQTERMPE